MQKIVPHLWFDTEAKEAADFYTSILKNSKVKNVSTITDTPSGDCDIVSFELCGTNFMSISAGPLFKFTPAISLTVSCPTVEEVDEIWGKFIEGGSAMMPLDTYPFSKRYGWVKDKYGLTWQINHVPDTTEQQIVPSFLFVGKQAGYAEEAINFYASIFPDSKIEFIARYGKDQTPDKEGTILHSQFFLAGQKFIAMDSAHEHKFAFNEAVSLIVKCDTQEEIDHYWEKLSAVPESEQCGWLKDKYGVSWQIVPTAMDKMMGTTDKEKLNRVTESFLQMKKFDIKKLEEAYTGE